MNRLNRLHAEQQEPRGLPRLSTPLAVAQHLFTLTFQVMAESVLTIDCAL